MKNPIAKPRDPSSFAIVEPRIENLAREIARLLSLVEFEKEGQPVEVDGFRLRDLSQWRDHQALSALDAVLFISGVCNSHCAFCFEHGVPFARETSFMSEEEVRTRLRHYSPETGVGLFASNRPQMETFLHPKAVEVLEAARQRDKESLFCVTTNGSLLDEATVERIARLQPLIIKFSLNVADEKLHRELMGLGARTRTSLAVPPLLRKHRIPFIGGIVAWPTIPFPAIEETVRTLEENEAYAIRIRLPLSHKYLRDQPNVDWDRHWARVTEFARTLRCRVPLYVEPVQYSTTPIVPRIDGVILRSPADRAGVHTGDVVEAINGEGILTRNESYAILQRCHDSSCSVELLVSRQGQKLQFHLEPQAEATYPYDPKLSFRGQAYGIFHVDDFRLQHLVDVFGMIERYGAKRTLLFTSPLVAPTFELLTRSIPEFAEVRKKVTLYVDTVPESSLGGNYALLDSQFVADIAGAIRRRLESDPDVDLILIPNAFGSVWGIDLYGESYSRLGLEFGIPVELIDWHFPYGRDI